MTSYFYYENFDVIFCASFYLKMDFMDTQVPNKNWRLFIVRAETVWCNFWSSSYSKMGFVDTKIPKKPEDFLSCVLKWQIIHFIGPVCINWKYYVIDFGKRLKVFRSNFNKMFTKFMTMGHLLNLIVLCFPLEAFWIA